MLCHPLPMLKPGICIRILTLCWVFASLHWGNLGSASCSAQDYNPPPGNRNTGDLRHIHHLVGDTSLRDPVTYHGETPTGLAPDSDDEPIIDVKILAQELAETQFRLKTLEEASKEVANALRPPERTSKAWFERYGFSGYTQFRFNETVQSATDSAAAQHAGDGSIGDGQSFFIRRARLVLSGDVNDFVSIYFQPDFAAGVPGSPDNNHYVQLRDWYADLHFDREHVWRIRVGQSKIPYGWENMQSSRNRLPLDRHDAFNSATKNERDLGAFFYWTPEYAQQFFEKTQNSTLKGSGNYGVFGLGFYNGQGGSLMEQNDNLHFVSRLTVPLEFENGQLMELGIQGILGNVTVLSAPISPLGIGPAVRPAGTRETGNRRGIYEERIGGTFVYYPQPFGLQAEWTVGRGPALSDDQTEVSNRSLSGGYAMAMYRHQTDEYGDVFPFVRWAWFEGGYRSERNAPFAQVNEWELGIEWQLTSHLELVGTYTITDRTNLRAVSESDVESYRQFDGDLLRFQLQVRY